MAFKFNPLTGKLDLVNPSGSTSPAASVTYAQFPRRILVNLGGSFTINKGGAVRIFSADFAQGFSVINNVAVNLGGSLSIRANGKGTVLGA